MAPKDTRGTRTRPTRLCLDPPRLWWRQLFGPYRGTCARSAFCYAASSGSGHCETHVRGTGEVFEASPAPLGHSVQTVVSAPSSRCVGWAIVLGWSAACRRIQEDGSLDRESRTLFAVDPKPRRFEARLANRDFEPTVARLDRERFATPGVMCLLPHRV